MDMPDVKFNLWAGTSRRALLALCYRGPTGSGLSTAALVR